MTKITCNYRNKLNDPTCPLCGQGGVIRTEHYFTDCKMTSRLAQIIDTTHNDLISTDLEKLRRAKNHLKKVEIMMEAYTIEDVSGK